LPNVDSNGRITWSIAEKLIAGLLSLAAASGLGISGWTLITLWNIHTDVNILQTQGLVYAERLEALEDWGPNRGDRYTAKDAESIEREFSSFEREMTATFRQAVSEMQASAHGTEVLVERVNGRLDSVDKTLQRLSQMMDRHEERLREVEMNRRQP
jgi:hypothetical protein